MNRPVNVQPSDVLPSGAMNGSESLVHTLLAGGIDTCFANPGTSEMHFVAALDRIAGMRCVLGLAETVVTGAADGYARMTGKPAATLLHCGPGFANGMANIHNARRARVPMVNIVGDLATYHQQYDTPLTSDAEGMARTVSDWVRTTTSAVSVGADAAAAIQAARSAPGKIATLVLPSDTSWDAGGVVGAPLPPVASRIVDEATVRAIAHVLLRKEPTVLLLSGKGLGEEGLLLANRIAQATGITLRTTSPVAFMARGRGRVPVDRIPYNIDAALKMLAGTQHIILAGGQQPAQFFAYPGRPSLLSPPDAVTHILARPEEDVLDALERLAEAVNAPKSAPIATVGEKPEVVRGRFNVDDFARTLAAVVPENCIIDEDASTSGRPLFPHTFNAPPHDWLQVTGGAIGHALPCATGAAIACPDRQVVCLQGDGSGMYCLQSLWTQARENLDVITVLFANRIYKVLQGELVSVGAAAGEASKKLLDIGSPALDWVKLANGMGVEATSVDTLEGFADAFTAFRSRRGPALIEFRI